MPVTLQWELSALQSPVASFPVTQRSLSGCKRVRVHAFLGISMSLLQCRRKVSQL